MKRTLEQASHAVVVTLLAAGTIAVFSLNSQAQDPPANSQQPAPDNTRVNKRDRKAMAPTALDQKNNRTDLAIAKQIRQLVMKDKSLSGYAHNVKIVAQDGTVTLKGPVRSDAEKLSIEAKAAEVVGKERVVSELAVKPKK